MAVIGTLSRLLLMKQVIPPLRSLATLSQTFNVTSSTWSPSSAGCGILTRTLPCHWSLLPVRTKKRGMEYQPKFLKRKRTHGWLKRISTSSGIQVILRRMLKGRKSLST